jgi:hypothetical protein
MDSDTLGATEDALDLPVPPAADAAEAAAAAAAATAGVLFAADRGEVLGWRGSGPGAARS